MFTKVATVQTGSNHSLIVTASVYLYYGNIQTCCVWYVLSARLPENGASEMSVGLAYCAPLRFQNAQIYLLCDATKVRKTGGPPTPAQQLQTSFMMRNSSKLIAFRRRHNRDLILLLLKTLSLASVSMFRFVCLALLV